MNGLTSAGGSAGGLRVVETIFFIGSQKELSQPAKMVIAQKNGEYAVCLTPGLSFGNYSLDADGLVLHTSGALADTQIIAFA